MPKISVIIPVYNIAEYLPACLDSVMTQTLSDIEIICIDDGSTDNSPQILDCYASKDSRFKVLKQSNLHAGVARNNGIEVATGDYIYFLDADDMIDPEALERLFNYSQKTPSDIILFFYRSLDLSRKNEIKNKTRHSPVKTFPCKVHFDEHFAYLLGCFVAPWNKLFRRAFLVENNILFDDLICANDRSFFFKSLILSTSILLVDDILMTHRINNNNSLTGTTRLLNFDVHARALKNVVDFCEENDVPAKVKTIIYISAFTDMCFFYFKAPASYRASILSEIKSFWEQQDISFMQEKLRDHTCFPLFYLLQKLDPSSPDDFTCCDIAMKKYDARVKTIDDLNRRISLLKPLEPKKVQLEKTIADLKAKLARANDSDRAIRNSLSFKVGRAMTYIPRKIRDLRKNTNKSGSRP